MRFRGRPCNTFFNNLLFLSTICLLLASFLLNSFFLYRHEEYDRDIQEKGIAEDLFLPRHSINYHELSLNRTDPLLQFAIIGFGKCGTTSVLKWLQTHSEIAVLPVENFDLMRNQPEQLIQKLEELPQHKLKGYKSPVDVTLPHVLQYFAVYFPHAKLIVGVRHPVQWFASLYNFRLQQQQRSPFSSQATPMPPPDELIGACVVSARNTCTYKGEFALFLRQLGKTKQPHVVTEFERRMYRGAHLDPPDDTSATQTIVKLEDHPALVANTLTEFLGLSTPLSNDIPYHNQQRGSSLMVNSTKGESTIRNGIMNICEHRRVRFELMRIARTSSVWIRNYFLNAPDENNIVTLPQFASYVKDWMMDPCKDRQEETQSAGRYILQSFRDEQEQAKHQ